MKKMLIIGLILLLIISGCGGKEMKGTRVLVETNMGNMELELYDDLVPVTVENFKKLVGEGFFDGQRFHRVIKGFMIQGGDPLSKDLNNKEMWGTGSLSYTINDEFVDSLKHDSKGVLSMANHGPDTGSNQFFVTLAATPWLDGKHAIFGHLTKGEDVLDKIGDVKTDNKDRPVEDVMINKVSIA